MKGKQLFDGRRRLESFERLRDAKDTQRGR